jgi:hypothetical protein
MFAIPIGLSSIACELSGGAIWAVICAFQERSLAATAPLKTSGRFPYGAVVEAAPPGAAFSADVDRKEV